MAGAWGYEPAHYDVSLACAERELLPKVRRAAPDALVVTDGFSCKTQIEQLSGRRALHLAQVLRLARDPSVDVHARPRPGAVRRGARAAALGAGAAAASAAVGAAARWRLRD
jgi:hypothetical protein